MFTGCVKVIFKTPMLNRKTIQAYRETAHRTLIILNEIERGETSPEVIAKKASTTRQLANYYLKVTQLQKKGGDMREQS